MLIEAVEDNPWDYVLRLRDGTVIRFVGAAPCENTTWVRLYFDTDNRREVPPVLKCAGGFFGPRGLDVRVSEIVWAADGGRK